MKFNEIMHLSFYTDQLDVMRDFYENKLGLKAKIIMRYEAYKGKDDRGYWAKMAESDPTGIAYIFIEVAPGQYLELFSKAPNQQPHDIPNSHLGYSHFALMVDDIHQAREELVKAGIDIDIEPNKGQSEIWQMWIHDPDGNKFEIMQYTKKSLQHKGNVYEDQQKYGRMMKCE